MKVVAINGSPRKDGNSAKMLKSWVEGIQSVYPEAEIDYVNLYSLKFTGCTSCFSCKRIGGKFYGLCPIKDDLLTLIPKIYEADAVAIASPIYFGEINGYTRCLLERTLFSRTTYRLNHEPLNQRSIPVTMIYTMNIPKAVENEFGYTRSWDEIERYISHTLRHPVTRICAYNTYQFPDYSKYEMELFTEKEKRLQRENQFPKDLQEAFLDGVEKANNYNG